MSHVKFRKNSHVPCRYFCNSHVDSKKVLCRMHVEMVHVMSLIFPLVLCCISISTNGPVEFKSKDPLLWKKRLR